MAAPSGGVNCEEFAEFQVMGFFSWGRRVLPFVPGPCSPLWPRRECGPVVGETGSARFLFPAIGGHGGRGVGLREPGCSVGVMVLSVPPRP